MSSKKSEHPAKRPKFEGGSTRHYKESGSSSSEDSGGSSRSEDGWRSSCPKCEKFLQKEAYVKQVTEASKQYVARLKEQLPHMTPLELIAQQGNLVRIKESLASALQSLFNNDESSDEDDNDHDNDDDDDNDVDDEN